MLKNVADSLKKFGVAIRINGERNLIFTFFFLCFVEAVWAFFYLVLLKTDPKNEIFIGFSLQRILLLAGVLFYVIVSGFLSIYSFKNNCSQKGILANLKKNQVYFKIAIYSTLIIGALAFTLFNIPETGLRGKYTSVFEKIDPILILIILFCIQCICLLIIFMGSASTPDQRKIYYREIVNKYFLPTIVFIFPFLFFFPRTIPINGEFVGVANDFIPTSYSYKFYLLDNLSQFHLPLWSPSEAAGFPFFSNPLAQVFYPFNIPLTGLYILNGGYSILDHQRFAVLGIAIFALGLFYWLKQFSLSNRSVFIASLLIPVSYRLAEIIRYPSGLHSAAWYPWILFSITKISTSTSLKKSMGYVFIFIFSCFCLVTGGYQYYLYYSLFLVIPYLLVLWIPKTRNLFFPSTLVFRKTNLVTLGVSGLISIIITAPYLVKMAQLLSLTTARSGNDFAFSTANNFNYLDTLGSLVYPPGSQTEGWYYFGFPCLVLIILYLASHSLIRSESWATNDRGKTWNFWYLNPWVKTLFVIFSITISYITYGSESYLFIFLWHYFPFFSHLRFLGRLNIVLIPVIALVLAISLDFISNFFNMTDKQGEQKNKFFKWWLLLFAIYLPLFFIQMYLIQIREIDEYWETYFYMFSSQKPYFILAGIVTFIFISISLYIFLKPKFKFSSKLTHWMVIFFILSTLDLWHIGAFMWWAGTLKTSDDIRRIAHITDRVMPESMQYKRSDSFIPASVMLTPVFRVGYSADWHYAKYKDFYQFHQFEPEALKELLGVTKPDRVFYTSSISYQSITDFLSDSKKQNFSYEIIEFTGDTLKLRINSPDDGYVSYIDNWDSEWKATVDNREVPIELLFTTFKSVKVARGISEVVFSYEPKFTSPGILSDFQNSIK